MVVGDEKNLPECLIHWEEIFLNPFQQILKLIICNVEKF